MSDRDQPAENLDEERLAGEYPPEQPLGVMDRGVTGLEQLGGESVEEREERTTPEVWDEPGRAAATTPEARLVEPGVAPDSPDDPAPVEDPVATGPLAPDDDITGDESTRDVVPERDPEPAEETAVHLIRDDTPGIG